MSINTYNGNGTISSTTLTAVEAHVLKECESSIVYDYALITVEEGLSDYVQFDLAASYNANATYYSNIPVYVTGCPDITNTSASNYSHRLYSGEGRIANNANAGIVAYDVDTRYGNSGYPVYTVLQK